MENNNERVNKLDMRFNSFVAAFKLNTVPIYIGFNSQLVLLTLCQDLRIFISIDYGIHEKENVNSLLLCKV